MAYLAIKKVKGRYYGYMQESYREAGRVRTRTVEYLGAIEPAVARQVQATRAQLGAADMAALVHSVRAASAAITREDDVAAPEQPTDGPPVAETADDSPSATHPTPPPSKQPHSRPAEPETTDAHAEAAQTPPQLRDGHATTSAAMGTQAHAKGKQVITTSLGPGVIFPKGFETLPIGRHALEVAHRRYRERLSALGADPAALPHVAIAYGHPERLKRNRDGSFTVIVSRNPKKKSPIRRDLLWRHYRQALAEGYLASLRAERPDLHHQLNTTLSRSHAAGKRLLFDALSQAPDSRVSFGLSLHLMIWDRLPSTLTAKAAAQDFGLHSFDTINDWHGEAALILAEASKKDGWNNLHASYQSTIRKHKAKITRYKKDLANAGLLDRLSGKRRKLIRQIMEAETKLKAARNLSARAQIIRKVLGT